MQGIAHISFVGGSVFLPARTPYDREMIVDYTAGHVRSKGMVQVIVDGQRWAVQLCDRARASRCSACGYPLDAICSLVDAADASPAIGCMRCAFGAPWHGKRRPPRRAAPGSTPARRARSA
jgi:hypothetical protein